MRRVVLITGMQAVVAGAVGMTPDPDPEAVRQLELRYAASALVAQHYADAGFDFVCSDIILGDDVTRWFESLEHVERHFVVLNPSVESIVDRELGRGSTSYRDWQPPGGTLADAVRALQESLAETPHRGLWLDTTNQTPEESVAAILENDLKSSLW